MFIEIPYSDSNGSVCPICGDRFMRIQKHSYEYHIDLKYFECVCKQNHFVFIRSETLITDKSYDIILRALISQLDWEHLFNRELIIGPNVFEPFTYGESL